MIPEDLKTILDRVAQHQQSEHDIEVLRKSLRVIGGVVQWVSQDGKFNTNVGQITGGEVHLGDRIYQGASAEAIRDIIRSTLQELQSTVQPIPPQLKSVDELVQDVRSRLHDDIQRLHGTMPLWGVDHWVPLGELFVDVNILEELSSSHRAELDDLWQNFSKNPGYRSLDRIGLGQERERTSGLKVLERNTNLMVVGKPGSGKTTYLQRMVTECNAGNLQTHRIPVLIKLRELVEDGRSLSYSLEQYLERCWQLTAAETQLVLKQGRSLVLLDGLDEVMGEDGKTITRQIKQFARAYPQVQMVVTCRTQSFSGEMDWKSLRFSFVEVADFNEAQVRSFTEHWFNAVVQDKAAGSTKSREFLDQLFRKKNKLIRELAITPILLSLTCAVFYQTSKFYSKRSKLYEEGLELLLEQWDKSREIERDEIYRDLSVVRKLELLSHLAVKKFEQEQYVLFHQAEIERYIAEFLEIGQRESRAVLKAMESQHGLLIERSSKIWSFSHLTFQEYLVTTWFCKNSYYEALAEYITEIHWREVLLLATEITKNPDTFLRKLKQKIDLVFSEKNKLQCFLKWADEKAKSIDKNRYKPSSIRAFYLYFEKLRFICIDELLHPARDLLCYRIDNRLRWDFLNTFNQSKESFSLSIHILPNDLALDIALGYLFDTDISFPFNFRAFNRLIFKLELTSKLKSDLESILSVLPRCLKDWSIKDRQNWFECLRCIVISHRNIGHDWHFSDEDEEKLNRYLSDNELLVNCLNNSSVSHDVREEIKETLLLPIAEIEKRKREKVE